MRREIREFNRKKIGKSTVESFIIIKGNQIEISDSLDNNRK
jgi:hypothetical protein